MLEGVRNDRIQFVTMRPPGSHFATLERRVVVTAPTEAVALSQMGDLNVLDKLIEMLQKTDRAWAAFVLLAALTRRDEKIVDSFAIHPNDWWNSIGKEAHGKWVAWLEKVRGHLAWDSEAHVFVEQEQS